MNISSPRLPFYSVLFAAFVPWINGIANSNVPGYLFDLVLIGLTGISLAVSRGTAVRMRLLSWVFLILFASTCFMSFILHRIHPLSDVLVVVPVTLAYVHFLGSPSVDPDSLLRQLRGLYAFHVGFIVVELILNVLDLRFVLHALSGDRYREFPFHLLGKVVLSADNAAPNSFLLQGQAASHLVASMFALVYLSANGHPGRGRGVLLLGLLVLFLLVISNTTFLIFALLAAAIWAIRATPATLLLTSIISVSIAWLFWDVLLAVVFYRVYDGTSIDYEFLDVYLHLFTVPFANILDARPMQLLFGHGGDRAALESGEVGFVTYVFIFGAYAVGLMFLWLAFELVAGFARYLRNKGSNDVIVSKWNSLLFVGIVLSAGWAMSTVHYLIVLIPGGMHLFAFGLAVVVTSGARLESIHRAGERARVTAGGSRVMQGRRRAGLQPSALSDG